MEEAWKAASARILGRVRGRRGRAFARASIAGVAWLRDLAALRCQAIATRPPTSGSEARLRYGVHAEQAATDPAYAAVLAWVVHAALAAAHRPPSR